MTKKRTLTWLTIALCFLPVSLFADTLNWSGIKIEIAEDNSCTVEVAVDVLLDSTENAHLVLVIQDSNFEPFGGELAKPVTKGYNKVALKRKIKLPKNLTELQVWTPLFTKEGRSKKLVQQTYKIQDMDGRRVAVIASEK